jgi:hypothetical protein
MSPTSAIGIFGHPRLANASPPYGDKIVLLYHTLPSQVNTHLCELFKGVHRFERSICAHALIVQHCWLFFFVGAVPCGRPLSISRIPLTRNRRVYATRNGRGARPCARFFVAENLITCVIALPHAATPHPLCFRSIRCFAANICCAIYLKLMQNYRLDKFGIMW